MQWCSLVRLLGDAGNGASSADLAHVAAEVGADQHNLDDEQSHDRGSVVSEGRAIVNDALVVSTGFALSAEAGDTEHDDASNDSTALAALESGSHLDDWPKESTDKSENIDDHQR